ncbi:glycoside hydrolase family 2 protein [Dactylosporangium sp. CA-233914]|uniref:glycoside hydrolase family 2 protein n=1 Tax=Dactylosporangium sp. CA-233914 TaxID=3239934 RepID=UPI003D90CE96
MSYPRPHFDRSHSWRPLDGAWEFRADPTDAGLANRWQHDQAPWPTTAVVPAPWEHPMSGVQAHWLPVGWYRRELAVPGAWHAERIIAHFGAVFHRATVWVNGVPVAEHTGGYEPFEADITDALAARPDAGPDVLCVRVESPDDKRFIPHGKQRSIPADDYDGCSFTPSSGIWQSVWLESRPQTHLEHVRLTPDDDLSGIVARITIGGDPAGAELRATIPGEPPVPVTVTGHVATVRLPVREPRLWSPADPHLYWVDIELATASGVDRVRCYTGLRRIEWGGGQLRLNGEQLYLRGVLDQGYWPESGLTPPSDAHLRADIELAAEAGFNLVRKHVKLEDPRWLYWADVLGMLVWAEPPSPGRYTAESTAAFRAVTEAMLRRDHNHPSIIMWGAYNEEWGLDWRVDHDEAKQASVAEAYDQIRSNDPSRPIIDNSGWCHVQTDLLDWHYYDQSPAGFAEVIAELLTGRTDRLPIELSAGITTPKPIAVTAGTDTGQPMLNSEYGGGWNSLERGWHLRWQTQELRRYPANIGYVYTELYDIEHETVGIYTFHRGRKDLGGTVPRDVHADTVIIPLLTPHTPGIDVVATGADLPLDVQVAHHGGHPLTGTLRWHWDDSTGGETHLVPLEPHSVSEALHAAVTMPGATGRHRLHLRIVDTEGQQRAQTFIDVSYAPLPSEDQP